MIESILIVDDDDISSLLVKYFLNEMEVCKNIVEISTGEEACEYLSKNQADIILLDVNMPLMDGFQFLDEFEILGIR